ncbi:unnamed protein product [Blepharisma stoltei]|uniref:Kelch motif family protein n=1 Tax=Blepharisma stoltei TaxID=1481888 RepID=A0AAU9JBW7_9CILI|nr:unnamed protein product [Blepharisma stoltei]
MEWSKTEGKSSDHKPKDSKIIHKETHLKDLPETPYISYIPRKECLRTFDVLKQVKSDSTINLPMQRGNINDINVVLCRLPENKYFCYCCRAFDEIGTVFCIDSHNHLEIFESELAYYQSFCVYCDGFVYVLGGNNKSSPLSQCIRFNLFKKRWERRANFVNQIYYYSGGQIQGFIIYSAMNGVNIYDPFANSHQEVLSNLSISKLVFAGNCKGYCLEFSGGIYESDFNNIFAWKHVGKLYFKFSPLLGYEVCIQNNIYFTCWPYVYKFSLNKYTVEEYFSFENPESYLKAI